MSQLAVAVTGFRSIQENNSTVQYFTIEVSCGSESWVVEHRFSEFDILHKSLREFSQAIPPLPPKTLWWQSVNEAFLQKRTTELHQFMRALGTIPFARNSFDYIRFLDVLPHFEPDTSEVPRVVKTVTDANFGVNDFVYSPTEGLLLTVCQDVNIVSRIDARLSSLPLPWEHEPSTVVPLGSFNCWIYEKASRRWVPRATLFFESQATSITWDATRRHAYLGLETGRICTYFGNNALSEFSLVREVEAHVGRVAALYYDSISDRIISVGRDSRILAIAASTGDIVSEARMNESWGVSLVYDAHEGLAYVGTASNKIVVYDMSYPQARRVNELSQHRGHVRALSFDPLNGLLISGSFDSTANIWTTMRGEAQRTQLSASLKNGPQEKVKSVCLMVSMNLAATGYEDGTIAIWDLRTSEMVYIVVGHEKGVVKIEWLPEVNLLVTASRDGKVNFWLVGTPGTQKSENKSATTVAEDNEEKEKQKEKQKERVRGKSESITLQQTTTLSPTPENDEDGSALVDLMATATLVGTTNNTEEKEQ